MAKQQVTGVQVQMAASAGVKLLQVDDLPVPMIIAKGGALGVLEGMLGALANGELVLTPPAPASREVAAGVQAALQPPKPSVDPPATKNNGGDAEVVAIAPVELPVEDPPAEEAPAAEK